LLLVVVVAIGRSYATQRKANKVKGELLQQKDMLMREIHHRVKNNLQVITALLELQTGKQSDEGVKEAMTESTARVRSISLIHQKLYKDEHITTLEFSGFANDLMVQVASAFKKPGQDIMLSNRIPATTLDIDTAVPLGLILNELMTNSFKYAFGDRENGSITMALERTKDEYKLHYSDDGPGLPEGMQLASLKSLGMKVMLSLSKQLGGSFRYDAHTKEFIVAFKDEVGRRQTD
jgi:two-component sensor histidine kinase